MMIVETDIAGAGEMQDTVPHTHRKAARARPAATGVCLRMSPCSWGDIFTWPLRGDRIIGLRQCDPQHCCNPARHGIKDCLGHAGATSLAVQETPWPPA